MGRHGGTTVDEQDESNTLNGSGLETSLKRGRRDAKGKPELAKYLDGMHCFDMYRAGYHRIGVVSKAEELGRRASHLSLTGKILKTDFKD